MQSHQGSKPKARKADDNGDLDKPPDRYLDLLSLQRGVHSSHSPAIPFQQLSKGFQGLIVERGSLADACSKSASGYYRGDKAEYVAGRCEAACRSF